jgi:hypothetical protein
MSDEKNLKYVHLYESFLSEAATVSAKTVKLNADIQEKVKLAAKLSADLKKLTEEYQEKIKPMQDVLNKYDEDIRITLTGVGVSQAKVEDIIAKVMMQKGRLTDSYKTLWEKALDKVNESTKNALLAIQAKDKKQNPDKFWMEYTKESMTNEGLKDIKEWGSELVNKVKTWAKDVWNDLKAVFASHEKAVDAFEKTGEKILAATKK